MERVEALTEAGGLSVLLVLAPSLVARRALALGQDRGVELLGVVDLIDELVVLLGTELLQ